VKLACIQGRKDMPTAKPTPGKTLLAPTNGLHDGASRVDAQRIPSEVAVMADKHQAVVSRYSAMWDGVVADLIVKGATGAHEVVVEPTFNTLFLTRTHDPHPVIKRLGKGPDRPMIHPGWLMNFVAAGDTLRTLVLRGNNGMDRFALSIMPQAVSRFDLRFDPTKIGLQSALSIDRPLIREIVNALAQEIVTIGAYGRMYAETLTLALTMEILREHGTKPGEARAGTGTLAPWQIGRVASYMNENLDADVSLAELAGLVDLSKSHFGRAFKASTGLAPHRWLLSARIQRAQQLLLGGMPSLPDVALATGFADQSHFTRAFRRVVGISPGAWQRERRR
jgi:AraC family transcriptional regulator